MRSVNALSLNALSVNALSLNALSVNARMARQPKPCAVARARLRVPGLDAAAASLRSLRTSWLPSSAVVQSCRLLTWLLTSLWLGGITGPNGASVHGPIAAAAAPVPTAVVPAATKPAATAPAPVEFYQTIEIFERGITRELEVKVRVDCVPVREWVPGGMAYPDLYKSMKIDTKVFDFHVRIITIMEGPYKGDAFVFAQDMYRICLLYTSPSPRDA